MDVLQLLYNQFHSSRTKCDAYNLTNYTDGAMDEILENGRGPVEPGGGGRPPSMGTYRG